MSPEAAAAQDADVVSGLIRTAALIQDVCATASAEHGLTPQQAQLMCVVGDTPSSMVRLAALLRVGKSTMTGLVHRAEQAGLVERSPDPADKRSSLIMLTTHGRRTNAAFRDAVSQQIDHIMSTLHAGERDGLATILSTIVDANQAPETWPTLEESNDRP